MQNQALKEGAGQAGANDGCVCHTGVRHTAVTAATAVIVAVIAAVPADALALTVDLPSTIDNTIAILPGLLVATLALVFAIRERGRSRRLQEALSASEQRVAAVAGNAATGASAGTQARSVPQLAAEHSSVGLWQTDSDGVTLYANPVMCGLFGVSDIEQLQGLETHRLLQPQHSHYQQPTRGPYRALAQPVTGVEGRDVLVFERTVHQEAAQPITLRTVIDLALLPDDLTLRRSLNDAA